MPYPQVQQSTLAESVVYTAVLTAAFPYQAASVPAQVLDCTPTVASSALTLPTVASAVGAVVTILNEATATGTILVKTSDGSTINGVAGATGVTLVVASASGIPTVFRLVNDGTNWRAF
jgi:hypothetical protein